MSDTPDRVAYNVFKLSVAFAILLVGCGPTPEPITTVEQVEVTRVVEIEKIVEVEVTKIVEVEKIVVVTATASPTPTGPTATPTLAPTPIIMTVVGQYLVPEEMPVGQWKMYNVNSPSTTCRARFFSNLNPTTENSTDWYSGTGTQYFVVTGTSPLVELLGRGCTWERISD